MGFDNVQSSSATSKPGFFAPYESAFDQVPDALKTLGDQLAAHPGETALRIGLDVVPSAILGAALTYAMPAGGPAGWMIGAAMTLPLAVKAVDGLWKAHEDASKPGANVNQVGKQLADSFVSNGFDMALNFGAGWAGAAAGTRLAAENLTFGDHTVPTADFAKFTQSKVLIAENKALLGSKAVFDFLRPSNLSDSVSSLLGADRPSLASPGKAYATDDGTAAAALTSSKSLHVNTPQSVLDNQGFLGRPIAAVRTRLAQLTQTGDQTAGMNVYNGIIHAHTILSDGDAQPGGIYAEAKAKGYDFAITSEHDHILARQGVEPTDERATAEKGTPIVGSDPQELQTQRDQAAAATVPGQFFADGGQELGTIGSLPPKLDAEGHQLPKGANHTGVYNDPVYVRSAEKAPQGGSRLVNSVRKLVGLAPKADAPITVEDIGDGQLELLQQYLDANADPNNPPFLIFNHPRVSQDFSPSVAANLQGHDYGVSRYPSFQDWLSNLGDKYGRQIEVMKGGALSEKPPPGGVIPPQWYDMSDAQIMWDKGAHLGVSAGPDIHYQARVGEPPLATSVVAQSLDKNGIYEAFNARRTSVTSNFDKVTAYMTANQGQYMMGNVLDGSVVPSAGLSPEVHIGGAVEPGASYTVNIWQDPQTGDGQLAKVVQTKTLTGSDLQGMNNVVKFDAIQPQQGSQSLFYAEVQRTDGASPHFGDIVGTGERNADGSPANVTVTPHGTFVKGMKDEVVGHDEPDHMHEPVDFENNPASPEVVTAVNTPPDTPYPERAITSPIFIDAPSGGTHSLLMRGATGVGTHTFVGSLASSLINPATLATATIAPSSDR